MKTLLDSFSYAAGFNVAQNMKNQGISQLNTALMFQAIDDVFKNKKSLLTTETTNSSLQKQLEIFNKAKLEAEKSRSMAFLEANKNSKAVIVLPSGLQYQVIKNGDSATNKPTINDTIVVNYFGTLIDGVEFDNSYKRGAPAVFKMNEVMKGWTEILLMMNVGSHWKVFIPAELGYGEAGYGNGLIPPNAAMIFEIILEGIKPGVVKPVTGN